MFCRVMLGWIIGEIVFGAFPVKMKLLLSLSVADPVEAHIHGFGSALNDCVCEDANGAFVVKLEWRGTLGMDHFL